MAESYEYEINGKIYIQKELVLAQIKQLSKLLEGMQFSGNQTIVDILSTLGTSLPNVLAVIVCEKNTLLKDKNIEDLANEFEFSVNSDIAVRIIEDFFDCNPIVSISQKIQAGLKNITNKIVPQI